MTLPKKAWLLLNYKQKKYAIFIFALMFLAMILESLSVGDSFYLQTLRVAVAPFIFVYVS